MVIAKNLEKDKQMGSPDHWLRYFVQTTPAAQKMDFKSLSVICRGTLRLGLCASGHLKIRTAKPLPWFSINGREDWNEEPGFTYDNRNFLVDEIGKVDALLRKRFLAPKTTITLDSVLQGEG